MPGFASAEEMHRYIGSVFEDALADPDLGDKMAATGLVLRVHCTEPECDLIIDLPSKKVIPGTDGPAPDATMSMSTETANAYWQGKVNLPFAMARGKVKVEGQLTKLLQLAPLTRKLFPGYVERLKADGREDLVVS
ncbi:SCP2 sterol-binding domain-containing protein [Sporichthya polymorpha]|uniref:SCP2 sterol-binding domain-containing protein n=1 Tax=Sporichthya polymorpha TaxID=35751 RepID=UPI000361948F|nr:SCP2 sterol-binding domain-containing protein [Sporichthya polymorpha]